MTDQIAANQAQQREIYGRTLQELMGALTAVYRIPQRRLAEVLGVSAPMLSQLMLARRVKMGSPRAHERLVALLGAARGHGIDVDADAARIVPLPPPVAQEILERVAQSDPSTTTQRLVDAFADVHEDHGASSAMPGLAEGIRTAVSRTELEQARDVLARHGAAPAVRALIDAALADHRPAESGL